MTLLKKQFLASLDEARLVSDLGSIESVAAFKDAAQSLVAALELPYELEETSPSRIVFGAAFDRVFPYFCSTLMDVFDPRGGAGPDDSPTMGARIIAAQRLAGMVGYSADQADALWMTAFHHCEITSEKRFSGVESSVSNIAALNAKFRFSKRLGWALCERAASVKVAVVVGRGAANSMSEAIDALNVAGMALGLQESAGSKEGLEVLSDRQIKIASAMLSMASVAFDNPAMPYLKAGVTKLEQESGWGLALEIAQLHIEVPKGLPGLKKRAP